MTILDIQRLVVERMNAGLPTLTDLALPPREWAELLADTRRLWRYGRGRTRALGGAGR